MTLVMSTQVRIMENRCQFEFGQTLTQEETETETLRQQQ